MFGCNALFSVLNAAPPLTRVSCIASSPFGWVVYDEVTRCSLCLPSLPPVFQINFSSESVLPPVSSFLFCPAFFRDILPATSRLV